VRNLPIRLLLSAGWAIALATAQVLGVSAQTAYPSPEAARPLGSGQVVPSADVRTVTGEPADLGHLVRVEGALLVFYRGGW
jgi:hypothetical protein